MQTREHRATGRIDDRLTAQRPEPDTHFDDQTVAQANAPVGLPADLGTPDQHTGPWAGTATGSGVSSSWPTYQRPPLSVR